jgi:hypothetical protein
MEGNFFQGREPRACLCQRALNSALKRCLIIVACLSLIHRLHQVNQADDCDENYVPVLKSWLQQADLAESVRGSSVGIRPVIGTEMRYHDNK